MGRSDPSSRQLRSTLDLAGATASFACAVHCAVVALLLGIAPAASFLAASWIEWAFLAVSLVIGLFALVPGYRIHHQRAPMLLLVTGLAMLGTMRAMSVPPSLGELSLVITAAACLISAHWINRTALHRCAAAAAPHRH